MDAQMLLSQDLYCNVFCVHGYNMNSVAYTILWNLWRALVSIQEKVSVMKSSQVPLNETMYALPEIYRRKKKE